MSLRSNNGIFYCLHGKRHNAASSLAVESPPPPLLLLVHFQLNLIFFFSAQHV